MANSRTGVPIVVDTAQLSALARELRRAAPGVWMATRVALAEAGQVVADDWKTRAGRWSSRMPQTIRVKVGGAGRIKVVGGGSGFPGGAAIENKGRPGTFRHPFFGDRSRWYPQEAHPDGAEALAAKQEIIVEMVADALQAAVSSAIAVHGSRGSRR